MDKCSRINFVKQKMFSLNVYLQLILMDENYTITDIPRCFINAQLFVTFSYTIHKKVSAMFSVTICEHLFCLLHYVHSEEQNLADLQLQPVLKAWKIFTIALSLLHHNQCTTSLKIYKCVTAKVFSSFVYIIQREVFQHNLTKTKLF